MIVLLATTGDSVPLQFRPMRNRLSRLTCSLLTNSMVPLISQGFPTTANFISKAPPRYSLRNRAILGEEQCNDPAVSINSLGSVIKTGPPSYLSSPLAFTASTASTRLVSSTNLSKDVTIPPFSDLFRISLSEDQARYMSPFTVSPPA